MTRKHFVAIAQAVKETNMAVTEKLVLANKLALVCAESSPMFDHHRFISACMDGKS